MVKIKNKFLIEPNSKLTISINTVGKFYITHKLSLRIQAHDKQINKPIEKIPN